MKVALCHHVYSTLRGYRTLYSSRGLPPDVAARTEGIAKRLYPAAGVRTLSGSCPAGEGWTACLRAFPCGRDDAGRARALVHTLLFPAAAATAVPWFNPLSLPDEVFLHDVDDLQAIGGELKDEWDAAPRSPARGRIEPLIVPLLLEPQRRAVVVDPRGEGLAAARTAADVLPAGTRRGISFLAGAPLDRAEGFRVVFVPVRPDERELGADDILIDLERRESRNVPERTAYADFVTAGTGDEPWRLAALLERTEPGRTLSALDGFHAVQAFRRAGAWVRPDGTVEEPSEPATAAEAVPLLLRAGCAKAALELAAAAAAAAAKAKPGAAGALRGAAGDAARLADEVRAAYGGRRADVPGDETTFISRTDRIDDRLRFDE